MISLVNLLKISVIIGAVNGVVNVVFVLAREPLPEDLSVLLVLVLVTPLTRALTFCFYGFISYPIIKFVLDRDKGEQKNKEEEK